MSICMLCQLLAVLHHFINLKLGSTLFYPKLLVVNPNQKPLLLVLHFLLASWPRTGYLLALSLSFLRYNMEKIRFGQLKIGVPGCHSSEDQRKVFMDWETFRNYFSNILRCRKYWSKNSSQTPSTWTVLDFLGICNKCFKERFFK